MFLGGEFVLEVAGGFRGGGPRGTLRGGFICITVVVVVVVVARGVRARVAVFVVIFVVVSRFEGCLRVEEFLEGKILVVLGSGGASESVGSRAIRPVAEGGSRTVLAVRRDVRGGRGEPVALHEHASLRAGRGEERREERGERREGERARHGHGVRRGAVWGAREKCTARKRAARPQQAHRGTFV